MSPIQKIVCPIDFSPCSAHAARYAISLAEALGASVDLLHTYQLAGYGGASSSLAESVADECKRDLDTFVSQLPPTKVPVSRHLRIGGAFQEINAHVKESGANLIVMGTTGRSGLEHFLLGSVAERVVQTAPVPVLTIRAPG